MFRKGLSKSPQTRLRIVEKGPPIAADIRETVKMSSPITADIRQNVKMRSPMPPEILRTVPRIGQMSAAVWKGRVLFLTL